MKLRFLFKTDDNDSSWSGNSPAVYEVTDGRGGYVIQGHLLDDDTRAQLRNRAANEGGVWIPPDIVEKIRQL
jgi:hypothetical protein